MEKNNNSTPKDSQLEKKEEIEISDEARAVLKAIGIGILGLFGIFIVIEIIKDISSDKDEIRDEDESEEAIAIDSSPIEDDDDDDDDYDSFWYLHDDEEQ